MRQLEQQQSRLEVVQAVAVAGHLMRVPVRLAVVAVQAHRVRGRGVVGGDRSTVAESAQVLARVEAEAAVVPNEPAGLPL